MSHENSIPSAEYFITSQILMGALLEGFESSNRWAVFQASNLIQKITSLVDDSMNRFLIQKYGLLKYLEELMMEQNQLIRENALWTLNNLYIGLVAQNIFPKSKIIHNFIIRELQMANDKSILLELVVWTCFILSSYKRFERQEYPNQVIHDCIKAMKNLVPWVLDTTYVNDVLHFFVHISQSEAKHRLLSPKFAQFFIKCLNSSAINIQLQGLHIVSNLLCTKDLENVRTISDHKKLLPSFQKLLHSMPGQRGIPLLLIALGNFISNDPGQCARFMESEVCEECLNLLLSKSKEVQVQALSLCKLLVQSCSGAQLIEFVEKFEQFIPIVFDYIDSRPYNKSVVSAAIYIFKDLIMKTDQYYRDSGSNNKITQELVDLGLTGTLSSLLYRQCLSDAAHEVAINLLDTFLDPVDDFDPSEKNESELIYL